MKRRSLLILSTAWAITSLFLACGGDDASQGTGADASTNDVTSDVANGGDSGGDTGGPGKDAGGGDSSSADSGKCSAGANCVVEIAVNGDFSCARMAGGTVRCWGSNTSGERGDGLSDGGFDAAASSVPTAVTDLAGVTQIAAGAYDDESPTACALLGDAATTCWGSNNGGEGKLGRGAAIIPSEGTGYAGATVAPPLREIRVGGTNACGVETDGGMVCWGQGTFDELGGPPNNDTGFPQAVPLPGPIVDGTLAVGSHNVLVREPSGKLLCWGEDGLGQCTDDGGASSVYVTEIQSVDSITSSAFGFAFGCAAKTTGEVFCWGYNASSVLGVSGGTLTSSPTPMQIALPAGRLAKQVCAGTAMACARLDDGSVWCWGTNVDGVAGDASTNPVLVPQQIGGLTSSATQVDCGYHHACALLDDGTVSCWGANDSGQLGRGGALDSSTHATAAPVVF